MEQPIILCGLGRVGWRVLECLQAARLPVVVVDLKGDPADPRLRGAALVRGDCRQRDMLEKAGVAQARGVLIVTNDDLVNISTALMVRSLHPTVRIVVRLFNQNLVTRLGQTLHNIFALSVSALTAPLLALTALTGDTLAAFSLDDGRRQVTELVIGEHSPLAGLPIAEAAARHKVLVVAHLPADGSERLLQEVDLQARLTPGDRLVVCAEPRDLKPLLAQAVNESLPHVLWAGSVRRLGRAVWRIVGEIDTAVKVCSLALLSVVVVSTLVYHFGISGSLPNGLFRTISVMATGGDLHEEELTLGWQKVFVSLLRLAGAALWAAFTAIVTNYLLRARLGGALEVRRIPDSGHVIVCGLGNVGYRVVEELLAYDEQVVAIEKNRDSRFLATTRRLGVAVIVGDATVLEVLRQAKAGTARAVVVATDNELANLEVALLARELNPRQRVVVRLSDAPLAETLREAANVRLALSIPTLAAPAFMAGLFGDRVQSVFLVAGRMLAVVELVVQADDAMLNDQSVRALAIDYHLLPVRVVRRDRTVAGLAAAERLGPGDRLVAIALLPDLERLLRRERVPADWVVEVTSFPLPTRGWLAQLVRLRRQLAADEADRALDQLPLRLDGPLTRGQAEDLQVLLHRERVTCRLFVSDGREECGHQLGSAEYGIPSTQ